MRWSRWGSPLTRRRQRRARRLDPAAVPAESATRRASPGGKHIRDARSRETECAGDRTGDLTNSASSSVERLRGRRTAACRQRHQPRSARPPPTRGADPRFSATCSTRGAGERFIPARRNRGARQYGSSVFQRGQLQMLHQGEFRQTGDTTAVGVRDHRCHRATVPSTGCEPERPDRTPPTGDIVSAKT